jgi:hypothetical protein
LSMRLRAGGNKRLFDKLFYPSLAFGLYVAKEAHPEQELGPAAADAAAALLRSTLLPQLQLMQLALTLKASYHQQLQVGSSSSSSSSSSRRRQQQQRQPSLNHSQHKYLLAMLQELGLSDVQVAAESFNTGASSTQLGVGDSSSAVTRVITETAERLYYSFKRASQHLGQCFETDWAEQPRATAASADAVSDATHGVDVSQLQQLSQLCQHAASMLLEAVHNMFGPAPDCSAALAPVAMYCARFAVLDMVSGSSSSSSSIHANGSSSSSSNDANSSSSGMREVEEVHSSVMAGFIWQVSSAFRKRPL